MPYAPFLLPLLETEQVGILSTRVLSPAEEERLLNRMPNDPWPALRQRVPIAYGIPLVTAFQETDLVRAQTVSSANHRALLVELKDKTLFLLEHPNGIELADQAAPDSSQIKLARPQLFLKLWRSTLEEKNEPPPIVEDKKSDSSFVQNELTRFAQWEGLSDWHLFPQQNQYSSWVRIDGQLLKQKRLSKDEALSRIRSICAAAGLESNTPRNALEGRLQLKTSTVQSDVRLSLVPTHYGTALNARFLSAKQLSGPAWDTLGLAKPVKLQLNERFASQEGLWIVAGPTGSGKTTTLHALLRKAVINDEKVISIEDPVERSLHGVQQVSLHSPPGLTYSIALKACLRQAPNTLMIGEIRDRETAAIALQAARTGHRVLTTLHARDTPGLLHRLADLGQSQSDLQQIDPVLLHQRLVPALCQNCHTKAPLPKTWASVLQQLSIAPPEYSWTATGCQHCHNGRAGRIALFALNRIKDETTTQSAFLQGAMPNIRHGRIPLDALAQFIPGPLRSELAESTLTHLMMTY